MRWRIVFGALVCFAMVNTVFLGYYLSSGAAGPVVFGPATTTSTASVSTIASTPGSTTNTGAASSTMTETVTSTTVQTTQMNSLASSGTQTSTSTTLSSAQAQVGSLTSSLSSTTNASSPGTNGFVGTTGTQTSGGAVPLLSGISVLSSIFLFFKDHSLVLAPSSWAFVGGMWIWRGRMRSKWTDLGFDSDVFSLFVKMKGAKTRIRLLDALSVPKDRLQLASELGLDWKSVDRHVSVMRKYGFLDDTLVYGRVRMYQLTPTGQSLLKLLQELSAEEKHEPFSPSPPLVQGEA